MNHNDRIDNLIRVRVQRLTQGVAIDPSTNFTQRVMRGVYRLEKHHQIKRDLWVLFLALFPVAFRELWPLVRGDYFAVAQLPMGSSLIQAYGVFMSELGFLILLGLSVSIFVGYLLRFRRLDPLLQKA